MKKLLFIIVMMIVCISSNYGQSPITIQKKFGGYQFYQDNKLLNLPQLVNIMQSNPESSVEIKKAKSSNTWASVFAFAGGFMVGWPIGTAIGGGDPEWALAGVGAGLIAISIPFSSKAKKHSKTAVDSYNSRLNVNSSYYNLELKYSGNGVGLVLNF